MALETQKIPIFLARYEKFIYFCGDFGREYSLHYAL